MQKMNTKNLLVSFMAIAIVAFMTAGVSAADLADITDVQIDGVSVDYALVDGSFVAGSINPVLIAGESFTLKVYFDTLKDDRDVTVIATIDTGKDKFEAETSSFRVAENGSYRKTLALEVPYELKDELSENDVTLEIEIEGADYQTDLTISGLTVERTQYDSTMKSLDIPSNVEAGETFPVDFVVKNTGYYDLDDLYVTVSVPALGIDKTVYMADLYALDGERTYTTTLLDSNDEPIRDDSGNIIVETVVIGDNDNEDTVSGRLYLKVPYNAEAGIYSVEVKVSNDDTSMDLVGQIVVKNDFANNVIVAGSMKTVAVGEDAEYSLLIVNPTDKLKVYKVIVESFGDLSSSASETVVAVPAGSSSTVTIAAGALTEGEYEFDVNVFSGSDLVGASTLGLNVEGKSVTSPIIILTVVLAIIFLVLLIVLIVLITKKPEKTEEFGESYY